MFQIVSAVQYCHQKCIVHRDLKVGCYFTFCCLSYRPNFILYICPCHCLWIPQTCEWGKYHLYFILNFLKHKNNVACLLEQERDKNRTCVTFILVLALRKRHALQRIIPAVMLVSTPWSCRRSIDNYHYLIKIISV